MPMPRDPEGALLQAVSRARLMEHTRTIAAWVRMSGSEEESRAFDYLEDTLRGFGLEVRRYHHDALISWPGAASLEVLGDQPLTVECITHAFAASAPPEGVEAEVVNVGSGEEERAGLRGRIALMDGLATPAKAWAAEQAGAAAAIFINPPRLHEMIISTVWGAPTPETAGHLPRLVAVSVREADGGLLRARARAGVLRVRVRAQVDTRWRPTPLVVADLRGREEPDRYVLFSGHVDSWHRGAMDNASANALMLEMAQLLSRRRRRLLRGIRFAFWSGHSHGRYSGSTWYADTHWEDLYRHAVLHLNVDSPGGKGATVLSEAPTMAETWGLAARCIKDVCGQDLARRRMGRMGDQSFWGIGVPSMFVELSAQPPEASAEARALASLHGGAPTTGGLGWWWHTPEDTVDKIDPAFLRRDAQVYALVLWRVCTSPILPLDYHAAAEEMRDTLRTLQDAAGPAFDLTPTLEAAGRLVDVTARFGGEADQVTRALRGGRRSRALRQIASVFNDALLRVGRTLIPVTYTLAGPFDQDRALPVPPIPGLHPVLRLRLLEAGSTEYHALQTRLLRERNRLAHALLTAAKIVEEALVSAPAAGPRRRGQDKASTS